VSAPRDFLLDTCVVSELVRPRPDPGVVAWMRGQDEETLFLSVLTIGELRKGVEKLDPGARKSRLDAWLSSELPARFARRLVPVDASVATEWGRLLGRSERTGTVLPVVDALVAATARVHGLCVVSRNLRDLERCEADVVNPWQESTGS
jgi:toxin FitB